VVAEERHPQGWGNEDDLFRRGQRPARVEGHDGTGTGEGPTARKAGRRCWLIGGDPQGKPPEGRGSFADGWMFEVGHLGRRLFGAGDRVAAMGSRKAPAEAYGRHRTSGVDPGRGDCTLSVSPLLMERDPKEAGDANELLQGCIVEPDSRARGAVAPPLV